MSDPLDQLPRRPAVRLRPLVLAAFLIAVVCVAAVLWRSRQTYHFAVVRQGVLYRDGARSESQFAAALDRVHPRLVVSLVDAAELSDPSKPQFAAETKLCAARGIRLDRIEVRLGGWPDTADIRRFLADTSDTANQPVLVHCAQGVRRTAFFVAAYQESVLGYSPQRAKDAILTFGHSDRTIDDIRRFIDDYDPRTRTVSPALVPGR